MSNQYNVGLVNVTSGSNIVTSVGASFTGNVAGGNLFIVAGDIVSYTVDSVNASGNIVLTANYGGTSKTNTPYVVHKTRTPNFQIPFPQKGDIETVTIIKNAIQRIDQMTNVSSTPTFTTVTSTGVNTAQKFVPTGNVVTGNGMYLPLSNTLAFSTNGVERIRVSSTGNVGIGTNNPTTPLQVNGTITATSFAGNATTATTLQTGRTINGTSFNGSANITTANWGTARTISIGGTAKSVNGSLNVTWSPSEIAANTASTLANARTFTVGNTARSFNGSSNVSWTFADIGVVPSTGGTYTGTVTATKLIPTGNVVAGNGMYLPTTNTLAFSTGGVRRLNIGSTGTVESTSGAFKCGNFSSEGGEIQFESTTGAFGTTSGAFIDVDAVNDFRFHNFANTNMRFITNNLERMRITNAGNVGIGTSSPSQKLMVAGKAYLTGALHVGGTDSSHGQGVHIEWNKSGFGTNGQTCILNQKGLGAGGFIFGEVDTADNVTERMRITNAGEIWIAGTTDRGIFNLQCNGTGVWGAGAYVNGSDKRIKENIKPLDSGLDVVSKLKPITYQYKKDWCKDQSVQPGFIAQDLLIALEDKSYVDGVVQKESEYMSVAYQNIIPILTKAIQELKAELDELKAQLT